MHSAVKDHLVGPALLGTITQGSWGSVWCCVSRRCWMPVKPCGWEWELRSSGSQPWPQHKPLVLLPSCLCWCCSSDTEPSRVGKAQSIPGGTVTLQGWGWILSGTQPHPQGSDPVGVTRILQDNVGATVAAVSVLPQAQQAPDSQFHLHWVPRWQQCLCCPRHTRLCTPSVTSVSLSPGTGLTFITTTNWNPSQRSQEVSSSLPELSGLVFHPPQFKQEQKS